MSTTAYIEARLINFYTALEIIDSSKSLSKQSIHSTLSIPLRVAEVIERTRNKLIHEGVTAAKAIKGSVSETKRFAGLKKMPFRVSGTSHFRIATGFYFYVLCSAIRKLMKDIGMRDRALQYDTFVRQ